MNLVPKLKILIAHSELLVAAGLHATLMRHEDLDVTMALAPLDADSAPYDHADVILADCETGIHIARSMQSSGQQTGPRVVIVTQDEREISIRRAIEGGVRGYLFLGTTPALIVQAVRNAARGGTVMDPIAASKMIDSLNGDTITRRELEVLSLVMLGSPNKIIASRLGIAVGTVKCHVKRLLAKLDARSRAEAAAIARQRGLVGTHIPGGRAMTADDSGLRVRKFDLRSVGSRHAGTNLTPSAGVAR